MKATHVLGLMLGLGTLVVASAFGCGSADTSGFEDPNGSSGGLDGSSPIFGKRRRRRRPVPGSAVPAEDVHRRTRHHRDGHGLRAERQAPLYNAIVYVPNTKPDALTKGATCDKCGAVTGNPVVSAISDSSGNFTLKNVPVGADIPLVIQIGKWRRQVTIPNVPECVDTKLADPELTRLPKKQSEGDMPQIALTTGGCDKLGCMLPKVGIDPSEFGIESDGPSKAVHTYLGLGRRRRRRRGSAAGSGGVVGPVEQRREPHEVRPRNPLVRVLERLENKGGSDAGAAFTVMADYMKAGGRIFTTDFMYTWYRYAATAAEDGRELAWRCAVRRLTDVVRRHVPQGRGARRLAANGRRDDDEGPARARRRLGRLHLARREQDAGVGRVR